VHKIYNGDYLGGATDIALGFMGVGIWGTTIKFLKFAGSATATLIRLKYLGMVKSLGQEVIVLGKSGKTIVEIAEHAVEARNAAKLAARALMVESEGYFGKIMVKALELRNYLKYGNGVGPTVEWLLKRGKSYEEIIESALRSNEKINSFLGVL
jgi:hypothetical protein